MLKGIDISHHQRGITSFGSDVDFVICKATEGVGYVDECCDKFYQLAKKQGKLLGVYHYARPNLGNSAEAEADWFVKNIKGYLNEAILVLDWEEGDLGNVTWAKAFLDRVKALTGIKPIIYMSASPMNSYNWSPVVQGDYGLWVANYGTNNGQPQEAVFNKYPLRYWSFYALWQYTSKGRISGYNGNVDMNIFSGNKEAWLKYANSTATPSTPSKPVEPPKKSNEEIANEVIDGKWGNGEDRKNRLTAAGYNYQAVQDIVNAKLGINKKVLKVGTNVKTIATGNGASDGSSNVARQGLVGKIGRIRDGAKYPYLVVNNNSVPLGWYKKEALEIV